MGGSAVALAIKVTADARSAAAELERSTDKVSKLGKAGKVAGRLLAAGLLVAAGAAIKFTNAAADDAQASAKLAATAQKVAGATKAQTAAMENWITAQGKSKGVTDDELRPALEKLLTVTHSVTKARKLASLAEDISARTGKSLESVTQALAKAQTGSVAGLAKYQVQTKDAEGKTRSLAAVQRDLAKAYKGAAADSADTAAGKAKILSVQMGELQEQIGTQLLPVMQKLTAAGLKVVDWISKNTTAAETIIGVLFGLLAIIKAISIAQGILNTVMAANPAVLITVAIIALAAALVIAYKKSETFRNIVNAVFGAIAKAAGAAVEFIRNHWRLLLVILGGPVGLAVALISKHWDTVKAGAQAVIAWIKEHWPQIKAVVVNTFETAKNAVSRVYDALSSGAATARDTVVGVFHAIRDAVQSVIDKVQSAVDKIASLKDKAGGVLSHIPGFGRTSEGGSSGSTPFTKVGSGNTYNINFQGPVLDPRTTADVIVRELRRRETRLGAAVA